MTPLQYHNSDVIYSQGNLRIKYGGGGNRLAFGSMPMRGGKYYWELTLKEQMEGWAGVVSEDFVNDTQHPVLGDDDFGWVYNLSNSSDNQKRNQNSNSFSHTNTVVNDTIGFLLDCTAGTLEIEINGNTMSSSEFTNIPTDKDIYVACNIGGGSGNVNMDWNFGQWEFQHAPTDHNDVCSNSLPEPTIKKPSDHFRTLTGAGADILAIAQGTNSNGTNWDDEITSGFTEDSLMWIKGDGNNHVHQYIDPINGTTAVHRTPLPTSTAAYSAPTVSSVAYCWKCDETWTNDEITAGRRNVDAGFSIVTYAGDNTTNRVIPHGLGKTPGWIILWDPNANDTKVWIKGQTGSGSSSNNLIFNTNEGESAQFSSGLIYQPTGTTGWTPGPQTGSTVTGVNATGTTYTAFVWAPVPGYSAMGEYHGTGDSNDGSEHVKLGFRPAWVMIKADHADSWLIYDSTFQDRNPMFDVFQVNEAEDSNTEFGNVNIDFTATGFKVWGVNGSMGSGKHYYVAFAESPIGGEGVPPATAR